MRKQIKRKEGLLMKGIKWLLNKKLLKNKVYSLGLMIIGYVSMRLLDGDATAFIFTLVLGLPVFFADENVVG